MPFPRPLATGMFHGYNGTMHSCRQQPDDVVGSPHLHVFARVYRVSNGSDQGRFRWYLNDVPASAGVQLQGIEDTQGKARQAANLHFQQWLKRVALRKPLCEARSNSPSPSPELSVREWQADAEDKAGCQACMLTSIDSLGE